MENWVEDTAKLLRSIESDIACLNHVHSMLSFAMGQTDAVHSMGASIKSIGIDVKMLRDLIGKKLAADVKNAEAGSKAVVEAALVGARLEHLSETHRKAGVDIGEPAVVGVETIDGSWPWCYVCDSYHHPDNPTCKARG